MGSRSPRLAFLETWATIQPGNLSGDTYPNGVQTSYNYDTLNRLTQMGTAKNAAALSNYAYTLGAAGNRTSVSELSGRTVNYGYDALYRLTSEAIIGDPANHNGTTGYTYDAVGNRQQLIVNGVTANTYTYDTDDRLGADSYDANGNTTNSVGILNSYDFENHMVQKGAVTIVYDGDGNRVAETVGGVTTQYLVDTQNPTGYAQVVDELVGGTVTRTYAYGLERINENQLIGGNWQPSFYGYDGHGSVRQLTNSGGVVTDTYDYDAFGNLINSAGSTPNSYLFAGEPYDPVLGLYYNRARYLNTNTGRFWSMDTEEGDSKDPLSLHRYLYVGSSPVNHVDPSGHDSLIDISAAQGIMEDLAASLNSVLNAQQTIQRVKGTLDLVETVYQVINTIASGGISAYLVGLPSLRLPKEAFEMALDSLAQNGSKALLLAATQPIMLEKVVEYFAAKDPAFVIFMPLPSPSILVGTPLKVKGLPVKLFFGGASWMSGRLLGLGMIKNQSSQNPYLQFFRMDYHRIHDDDGAKDLVPSWTDGVFHFHIPRPN